MKFTNEVKSQRAKKNEVTNFMGGKSYKVSPITTLKLVTASSIFGEPQYYRRGEFSEKYVKKDCRYSFLIKSPIILKEMKNMTTSIIMEKVIDEALSYDFKKTLEWAVELRNNFNMRLNPQVILVRAAIHPKRVDFNKNNPLDFKDLAKQIVLRGDEPASGLTYYLYKFKTKSKLPNILKDIWANKLESLSYYQLNKYKKSHIGMIDTIRICHANNHIINDLMHDKLVIKENNKTWQNLRSEGKSWSEIIDTIKLPHFALLNNLRGILTEDIDKNKVTTLMYSLKDSVLKSKVFPFRYYTAYAILKNAAIENKRLVLDTLEECIDISLDNLPALQGKTACLSDNSGSAWGALLSEYGTSKVAHINNLSAVITAANSEDGEVFKFGDKVKNYPISRRNGVLYQTEQVNKDDGCDVGLATENGVWLFFKRIIEQKIRYDNIFIYSDMQAGHGGLYGCDPRDYIDYVIPGSFNKIDIIKLINKYRSLVYKNVNIYLVQTAGYDNVILPEYLYRTTILSGWTGKELLFANKINKIWQENNN